jgi:hypothetical protein
MIDIDTVLSKESIQLIHHWNPELARMLEFFDHRYDRDCSFLTKTVEMFHHELRRDDEFRELYERTIRVGRSVGASRPNPPDGV